jgi:hypothetical protein
MWVVYIVGTLRTLVTYRGPRKCLLLRGTVLTLPRETVACHTKPLLVFFIHSCIYPQFYLITLLTADTADLYSPRGVTAPSGSGLRHYRSFMIPLRHTTLGRTPLDEWSARHRCFYLTTHDAHKRDIHVPCWIGAGNPSKRAAADPRLWKRGHWDQQGSLYGNELTNIWANHWPCISWYKRYTRLRAPIPISGQQIRGRVFSPITVWFTLSIDTNCGWHCLHDSYRTS